MRTGARCCITRTGQFDAACVATPDHMHAPQAISAMHAGLPVYVQKPLAHDIHEVRTLMKMAREKKLATQMGIQVHSAREYKAGREGDSIGRDREGERSSHVEREEVGRYGSPAHDCGCGAGRFQLGSLAGGGADAGFLKDVYHPSNWRKRLDFGTATFGDMGCHILDPVFSSLELGSPVSVRSEGAAPNGESWALNTLIRYVFPGTDYTAEKTVPVTWYDGDRVPSGRGAGAAGVVEVSGAGIDFHREKGQMLLPHVASPILLPLRDFTGFVMPEAEKSNHYFELVEAVLGNGETSASFDYSGPLTESVLLGPLATRFPNTTLEWNGVRARFGNSAEANGFLRRRYRAGWSVAGLG